MHMESLSPEWSEVVSAFLLNIEDHSGSKRSRDAYAYNLHAFLADHSPESATRTDVLNYINAPSRLKYQHGRPVSAAAKNQRHVVLASFYRFASLWELPNGEPILDHKMPTQGIPFLKCGSEYRGMNQTEVEAFFSCIPNTPRGVRDRSIFVTLFWTGRRRGELVRLRVRDISETIIVDPSGATRPGFLYRCKIKGHQRETFTGELPGPAMAAIREYWRVSGREDGLSPESFVWTNVRHSIGHVHYGEHLCGDWIADSFTEYAALAGLDTTRVSVHSLRRCGALLRYQNGASLESLRIWLNHTSLHTTQRYIQSVTSTADPEALRLQQQFGHIGRVTGQ
jgi:integrase/recombinase XerD